MLSSAKALISQLDAVTDQEPHREEFYDLLEWVEILRSEGRLDSLKESLVNRPRLERLVRFHLKEIYRRASEESQDKLLRYDLWEDYSVGLCLLEGLSSKESVEQFRAELDHSPFNS